MDLKSYNKLVQHLQPKPYLLLRRAVYYKGLSEAARNPETDPRDIPEDDDTRLITLSHSIFSRMLITPLKRTDTMQTRFKIFKSNTFQTNVGKEDQPNVSVTLFHRRDLDFRFDDTKKFEVLVGEARLLSDFPQDVTKLLPMWERQGRDNEDYFTLSFNDNYRCSFYGVARQVALCGLSKRQSQDSESVLHDGFSKFYLITAHKELPDTKDIGLVEEIAFDPRPKEVSQIGAGPSSFPARPMLAGIGDGDAFTFSLFSER